MSPRHSAPPHKARRTLPTWVVICGVLVIALAINGDTAEASRLGVRQTPTIYLNGRFLQLESLDYAWFASKFDSLLQ